jgi:stage II sporulation protein R
VVLRVRLITVGLLLLILVSAGLVADLLSGKGNSGICNAYNRANLIRLHVIANSDSSVDQALKLKVRDRILQVSESLLLNVEDPRQAEAILEERLGQLAAAARAELLEQQQPMAVKVRLGKFKFPAKQYSFGTLEAGRYKGLQVVIGAGKGHNWWCVLYPPFCLLSPDAATTKKLRDKRVKVEYKLAILEKLVRSKGLTMNRFWKKWGKSFGML